jgi:hypothetical protein
MSDNETTIIAITSIEPTEWGCKISAQDKRVYNVSKTKKDGTESVAWRQMIDMGLKAATLDGKPGSTVEIWFREVLNKHGGTSRYISSFKETIGQPPVSADVNPKVVHTTPYRPNSSVTESPKDDAFYEKLAYTKCCSIWAAAVMGNKAMDMWNIEDEIATGKFWKIFQAIKADGDKRFSPLRAAIEKHAPEVVKPTEDLPTTQVDDGAMDSLVSEIDF